MGPGCSSGLLRRSSGRVEKAPAGRRTTNSRGRSRPQASVLTAILSVQHRKFNRLYCHQQAQARRREAATLTVNCPFAFPHCLASSKCSSVSTLPTLNSRSTISMDNLGSWRYGMHRQMGKSSGINILYGDTSVRFRVNRDTEEALWHPNRMNKSDNFRALLYTLSD